MDKIQYGILKRLSLTSLKWLCALHIFGILSGCGKAESKDTLIETAVKTPTPEEDRVARLELEAEAAAVEAKKRADKLLFAKNVVNEKKEQLEVATQNLNQAKSIFNPANTQRNPIYLQHLCTSADALNTTFSLGPESKQFAIADQKAQMTKFYELAKSHFAKAESLKKSGDTVGYLASKADYWVCQHNVDFFATKWYVEHKACEKELEQARGLMHKAETSFRSSMSILQEKVDAITYGVVSKEKVERLSESMSIESVEKIMGPGRLIRTFSYYDGRIELELDEYSWECINGNGRLVVTFDHDRLYQKKVYWTVRASAPEEHR